MKVEKLHTVVEISEDRIKLAASWSIELKEYISEEQKKAASLLKKGGMKMQDFEDITACELINKGLDNKEELDTFLQNQEDQIMLRRGNPPKIINIDLSKVDL